MYVDKGSSMDIKKSSHFNRFFHTNIEIVVCEAGHQMRNFSETSIRLCKRILSSVFHHRNLKSLPNLTMIEITNLISSVKEIANSKPISGNFDICPNHFFKPDWLILPENQMLEHIQCQLSTALYSIIEAAGSAQKNFIEILKRSWHIAPRHHQLTAGKEAENFKVNDIVIYLIEDKSKLARITKVHGSYSTILVGDKNNKTKYKNIHHKFLIFLFRSSSMKSDLSKQSENEGS